MSASSLSPRPLYVKPGLVGSDSVSAVGQSFNLAAAKRAAVKKASDALMDLTLGRYQTIQDDPKLVLEFLSVCKEETSLVLSQLFDAAMQKGEQLAEMQLNKNIEDMGVVSVAEMAASFNQSVSVGGMSLRGGGSNRVLRSSPSSRSPQRSLRPASGVATPSQASDGMVSPSSGGALHPRSRLLPDNFYTKTEAQLHEEMLEIANDPESGETMETLRERDSQRKQKAANEIVEELIRQGAHSVGDRNTARKSTGGGPLTSRVGQSYASQASQPPPLSPFQSPFNRISSAASFVSGATSAAQHQPPPEELNQQLTAALNTIDELKQALEVAQFNENFLRSTAKEMVSLSGVNEDRILTLRGTLAKREATINDQRRAYIQELLHVREMLRQYKETGACTLADAVLYNWDASAILESRQEDTARQVAEAVDAVKKTMKVEFDQMESALRRQIEDQAIRLHALSSTVGAGGRRDATDTVGQETAEVVGASPTIFSILRRRGGNTKDAETQTQTKSSPNSRHRAPSFSEDDFLVEDGASSDVGTQQGEDPARAFVELDDEFNEAGFDGGAGVYEDLDMHSVDGDGGTGNVVPPVGQPRIGSAIGAKRNPSAKSRASRPGTAKTTGSRSRPASAATTTNTLLASSIGGDDMSGTHTSLISTNAAVSPSVNASGNEEGRVHTGKAISGPRTSNKHTHNRKGILSISPATAAELRHKLNTKDTEIARLASTADALDERCSVLEEKVADRNQLLQMYKGQIERLTTQLNPPVARTPTGLQFHTTLRSTESDGSARGAPHHNPSSGIKVEGPLLAFQPHGVADDEVQYVEEFSSTSGLGDGGNTPLRSNSRKERQPSLEDTLNSMRAFEEALKQKEEVTDKLIGTSPYAHGHNNHLDDHRAPRHKVANLDPNAITKDEPSSDLHSSSRASGHAAQACRPPAAAVSQPVLRTPSSLSNSNPHSYHSLRREVADLTFKYDELERRSRLWKAAYDAKDRAPLLSAFLDQALMDLFEAVRAAEEAEDQSNSMRWRLMRESLQYKHINATFEGEIKALERGRAVDSLTLRKAHEQLDSFQRCYQAKIRRLSLGCAQRRAEASDDWDAVLLLARGLAEVVGDPAKYACFTQTVEGEGNAHPTTRGPLRALKLRELEEKRLEATYRAQRMRVQSNVLERYSVASSVPLNPHHHQKSTQEGVAPHSIPTRSFVETTIPARGPATATSYQYTTENPDGVALPTRAPPSMDPVGGGAPSSKRFISVGFGRHGPAPRPHSALGCYYHRGAHHEDIEESPEEAAARRYVLDVEPTAAAQHLLDPRGSLKAADQRTKMLARRGIVEDPSDVSAVRVEHTESEVGKEECVASDPQSSPPMPRMERLSQRPASASSSTAKRSLPARSSSSLTTKRPLSAASHASGGMQTVGEASTVIPTASASVSGFDVGAFRTFNAVDKRRTLVDMMRSDQAALARDRQEGAKAIFALRTVASRPTSASVLQSTSSIHHVSGGSTGTTTRRPGSASSSNVVLARGATITTSDEVDAGVYRTKLFGRNERAYL